MKHHYHNELIDRGAVMLQSAPSPDQFYTASQSSSSASTTTRTEAITFTILGVAFIGICVGLYILLTRAA